MNLAHLHLLLNHFPIIGSLFGIGFLVARLMKRSPILTNAAKVVILIVALATIPTFFTREPAEKQIEGMLGISKNLIHAHEDAALLAFIVMLAAGAIALLLLFKYSEQRSFHIGLLIVTIIAFGLIARAGNLGGQIQHEEIRGITSATPESVIGLSLVEQLYNTTPPRTACCDCTTSVGNGVIFC